VTSAWPRRNVWQDLVVHAQVNPGVNQTLRRIAAREGEQLFTLVRQFDEVSGGMGIVVGLQRVEDEWSVLLLSGGLDLGRLPLEASLQTLQFLLEELALLLPRLRGLRFIHGGFGFSLGFSGFHRSFI